MLILADSVLVAGRVWGAFSYLHATDMEDIGRTTIAAVHAVLAGQNPYAAPIDLHPEYPDFPGYKYLPVMIAAYAPLTVSSGEVGLRFMNLLLDLGMSVAIFAGAMKIRGPVAGM